jgi:glucose uptake protein GlcU
MKKLLDNLFAVGGMLIVMGVLSFLLSLVNLEFKALSFLGENKTYIEIASIVIGIILVLVSKVITKNFLKDEDEE